MLVGDELGLRDDERLAGRASGRGCRGFDVDPGPDSLALAADMGLAFEEGLLEPSLQPLADPVGDGVLALGSAVRARVVPQELVLAQLGDLSLQFGELGDDHL